MSLYIRPVSWLIVYPELRSNKMRAPTFIIFGYNEHGKGVIIQITIGVTISLSFPSPVTEFITEGIREQLLPLWIRKSPYHDNHLIIRNPILPPFSIQENMRTWASSSQNPQGDLAAFFQSLDLEPYRWMEILAHTKPIAAMSGAGSIEIQVRETDIQEGPDLGVVPTTIIFWDIARLENGQIVAIAAYVKRHDKEEMLMIINGKINTTFLNKKQDDITFLRVDGEEELINKFYALLVREKPDRMVGFDTYTNIEPHLVTRAQLYRGIEFLPNVKVKFLPSNIRLRSVANPLGVTRYPYLEIPGVESIDLAFYYKKVYPDIFTFNRANVTEYILGHAAPERVYPDDLTKQPDLFLHLIDNLFVRTMELTQLWDRIAELLEFHSNRFMMTIPDFLLDSDEVIVRHILYSVDPSLITPPGQQSSETYHKIKAAQGIHKEILVYDYAEIYRRVMEERFPPLGEKLQGAPSSLVYHAYTTLFANPENNRKVMEALEEVINTKFVIEIGDHILLALRSLPELEWLVLVDTLGCYVCLPDGWIAIDSNDRLHARGAERIIRPLFPLEERLRDEYIRGICRGKRTRPRYDLEKASIEDLTLTTFITPYPREDSVGSILLAQYQEKNTIIQDDSFRPFPVPYLYTEEGPQILEYVSGEARINYPYYQKEIESMFTQLSELPRYF